MHTPRILLGPVRALHQASVRHAQGDGQVSPGGNRRDENGFASAAAPTSGGMGSPLTRTPFRLNLLQDSVTEVRH